MPYSYETGISRNLKASRMNKYLRAGGAGWDYRHGLLRKGGQRAALCRGAVAFLGRHRAKAGVTEQGRT